MILSINSLEKSYGRIRALNGVSFQVPEGSVYGILGPNGSGKTTLLSIVLGVLHADRGSFSWFGQEGSPLIRKQIGSLLETPNFYHYLSGTQNLRITQSISGRGSEADIQRVLSLVNLAERKDSRFSTYSLGMKQRLAIAAALLGNPRVLVLDEPTNGLDPVGIAEIRQLIGRLSTEGHTIIIASHLLDEVEKICSHVAILKKGVHVLDGLVADVLADTDLVEMSAEHTGNLLRAIQDFTGIGKAYEAQGKVYAQFEQGQARLDEINRFCFQRNITLTHLVMKRKRLEDRFFELTGNVSHD